MPVRAGQSAMPDRLNETSYALACDVGRSRRHLEEAELRLMLEEIRYELIWTVLHAAPSNAVAAAPCKNKPSLVGRSAKARPYPCLMKRPSVQSALLQAVWPAIPGRPRQGVSLLRRVRVARRGVSAVNTANAITAVLGRR